uniref:Uncharacterized protein n=1 Tax=Ciona intestinalis TaxID=7719 RepID=H2XQB9_CIOIN
MQEARWGGSGSRTKQELHCMYHFLEEPLYENAKINQHCRKSTTVPVSLLILHHSKNTMYCVLICLIILRFSKPH